ncbi:UvrD-helicase domain-containing protein [Micromonospora sp. CPCC 205371]|nr:UvrD-helicase domain-containing protein [Micromonospora sp. CPCC 205371]
MTEELRLEQRYFEAAAVERERMRATLASAPGAAVNSGTAVRIRRETDKLIAQLGEPDDPVAFGRMDDDDGETLYIGHHGIRDEHRTTLVVNWKAPAAAPFYEATHKDSRGLRRKRTFVCTGNQIVSFDDILFSELSTSVAELEAGDVPDDALLADLNRDRTGAMQEIVRTIQAAQYELIRAPMQQLLVIQGGAGTGKTAVALHRVSWLLYDNRADLSSADVLIVGPSTTFTRYTRTVLPSLGDTGIEQRAIGQLHPPVKQGRVEAADLTKLKGEARMAGLLRRALYARIGSLPPDRPLQTSVAGRPLTLTSTNLQQMIAKSKASLGTFAERRQIFRGLLTDHVAEQLETSPQQVRSLVEPLLERIWPSFTAPALLRDLLGSRERLIAAAGDDFTARDIAALYRRPAERIADEVWSQSDLLLLDELEDLINGVGEQYAHIVVDEAQDFSPMQLRAVSRRSANGSLTVVGDIAQSTGPWARDDWDDVLAHLPSELPQTIETLKYGYRVPRQIFELAAPLLAVAAPTIEAPTIVRDGPSAPALERVSDTDRARAAIEAATSHAAKGRSVGIICPGRCREEIEAELRDQDIQWYAAAAGGDLGRGINLVSPQEAKGLEFDAVIVVEPEYILDEDDKGHRLLYVAFTRPTRYLHVLAVGAHVPLPANAANSHPSGQLNPHVQITTPPDHTAQPENLADTPPARERPPSGNEKLSTHRSPAQTAIDAFAVDLADQLRAGLAPALWPAVLERMSEVLDLS